MADIPATPFEKFLSLRVHYIEQGKEFRENDIRDNINATWEEKGGDPALLLPLVDNPETIEASDSRKRAIRMDDREAKAELEKARLDARTKLQAEKSAGDELSLMKQRNAELEERLAALEARQGAPAGKASKAAPASKPTPAPKPAAVVPDGAPTVEWQKPELLAFIEREGLERPKGNPQFISKNVLLESILGQLVARQPAPPDGAGGPDDA